MWYRHSGAGDQLLPWDSDQRLHRSEASNFTSWHSQARTKMAQTWSILSSGPPRLGGRLGPHPHRFTSLFQEELLS